LLVADEWTPPRLRDHADGRLPPEADFFADPPPDIGALCSADTTLRQHIGPWPAWARWSLVCGLGLVGLLGGALGVRLFPAPQPLEDLLLPIPPAVAAAVAGWFLTRFRHSCSYVGRSGLAHYVCGGRRGHIIRAEVLRFPEVCELRAAQTRRYAGGRYRDTLWSFVWLGHDGQPRFELHGKHHSEAGLPRDPHDPVHFALAAELAWTLWLLGDAYRRIDRAETVPFRLGERHGVGVGRGHLIFVRDQNEERWAAEEIAEAVLENGILRIRRFDAREGWEATGGGEFRFDLGQLSNARLFLRLLETAAGVPVR
jgi:hypothetical protein